MSRRNHGDDGQRRETPYVKIYKPFSEFGCNKKNRLNREHFRNLGLIHEELDQVLATRAAVLLADFKTRKRIFSIRQNRMRRFQGNRTRGFHRSNDGGGSDLRGGGGCKSTLLEKIKKFHMKKQPPH